VENHGSQVRFLDDSQFYSFTVISPSGAAVQPIVNRHVTRISSEPVVLETGTAIRRKFNLLCGPDLVAAAADHCDWRYAPTAEGVYRVVARYESPFGGSELPMDGGGEIEIESDTIQVRYRL
jgi:hypothetical protein